MTIEKVTIDYPAVFKHIKEYLDDADRMWSKHAEHTDNPYAAGRSDQATAALNILQSALFNYTKHIEEPPRREEVPADQRSAVRRSAGAEAEEEKPKIEKVEWDFLTAEEIKKYIKETIGKSFEKHNKS